MRASMWAEENEAVYDTWKDLLRFATQLVQEGGNNNACVPWYAFECKGCAAQMFPILQ